ncbi:MAG: 3-deoxy-manno-octulosonate cytidylyltransferase [Candidatus Eisenbacteria bacterium]
MGRPRDDLVIIIPARLESTRLPRKLLIEIAGRSVLEWTWRRASAVEGARGVWIATDNDEIARHVEGFGGAVLPTRAHPTGTHRVAEAAARLRPQPRWIINLQGDEPLVSPAAIGAVAAGLRAGRPAIVTAGAPLGSFDEWRDPGVVKVVCGSGGQAIYFSRCPIPGARAEPGPRDFDRVRSLVLQHIGIYGFSHALLRRYVALPASPLAEFESLEQLRALEAGMPIRIVRLARAEPSVDTPADLERVRSRLSGGGGRRAGTLE